MSLNFLMIIQGNIKHCDSDSVLTNKLVYFHHSAGQPRFQNNADENSGNLLSFFDRFQNDYLPFLSLASRSRQSNHTRLWSFAIVVL